MIGGHLSRRLFATASAKSSSHYKGLWARPLPYLRSLNLGSPWALLRTRILQRTIVTSALRGPTIRALAINPQVSKTLPFSLARAFHLSLSLRPHSATFRGPLLSRPFSSKPSSPSHIDSLPSSTPPPSPPTGKKGMAQKLREFLRQYGKLGVIVYFSISAITFGTIYVALRTGVDVKALVASLGLPASNLWDGAGTLAVAYAIYKVLMPLRIFLAIGTTTWIAKKTRFGARLTGSSVAANNNFINQRNGESTPKKP